MKRYNEDEYLMLSGIQHFVFCRRQWALIHIEQQWAENYRTVDGELMHKNVHDSTFSEKRGDLLIERGMPISSPRLGISGECDAVEFKRSAKGVELFGKEGKYIVTPVEYKRGAPKIDECDCVQLAAQVMCLEDMLCCEISEGYLYYGETRRRLKVEINQELRAKTESAIEQMHDLFTKGYTPKGKRTKACNACSLKNICLPVLCGNKRASDYLKTHLYAEDNSEEIT